MNRLILSLLLLATPLWSAEREQADIVILGEVHDNPAHHATQAARVAELAPAALVFEMLTAGQAARVSDDLRPDADRLAEALGWADSGWPDFAMYHPIFTAAPDARVYGAAVPRAQARAALEQGIVAHFGAEDAARFGLDRPLPGDQLTARLAFQQEAHCGAMPEAMLPVMVDLQRLRDAELARVALAALDQTGGPVAVITGNGHARRDWGMPVYLLAARPDVTIFALGQSEAGGIAGSFDEVVDAPAVDRPDPCAAFAKD